LEKRRYLGTLPIIFTIIGFLFSYEFQSMAYWGRGLTWYWFGASLAYVFSVLSLITFIMMRFKKKIHTNEIGFFLTVISVIVSILTILWTTFVIIAGMSGM
jgi:hypothetical protein